MKSPRSFEKQRRVGFKRPVPMVQYVTEKTEEEEKENNDIDSNSISSPEEIQTSLSVFMELEAQEIKKFTQFEIPKNMEKENTIPEPSSDMFESNFNWVTENNVDFMQSSDCDDFCMYNFDFMNVF